MAIKIGTYKLRKAGARGAVLQIPAVWMSDVGAKPKDRLDIFRDENDRLIIEKAKPAETRSPIPASEKR